MKVLIPDKLNELATEILEKQGITVVNKAGITVDELIKIIPEYDGMIVRSGIQITPAVIDAATNLKIVVRAGVGYDNIDAKYAAEKGIIVANTPFGNTNAAAEHTLTLLMMLAKHIIHAHHELKRGVWDRKKYKAIELKDRTLGIIGLGNIGKKIAKVAIALEMIVIGSDPFVTAEEAQKIGVKKVELDELYAASDFITVHVPKTPQTSGMIDSKAFQKMKDGVRILNVARGGVIKEKDLELAIVSGKVAAAALDVYEQEPPVCHSLLAHDSVICTPHLGASTHEAQINVAVDAANQIVNALKNNKLDNVVNGVEKVR